MIVKTLCDIRGWRGRGFDGLAGAVAVLGQAPFHIWPLTLLSLAYLIVRLSYTGNDITRATPRSGFSRGFFFGFGYFLAGTFWIGSAFIARGPEFIPVMPPMILGLACLLALFWGIAGAVFVKFYQGPNLPVRIAGLVCLLWLAEFARGHVMTGFPWNLPGYIFKAGGSVSQTANFFGIYGLTFFVFFLAGCLSYAVMAPKRNRIVPVGMTILLFAGLYGYGFFQLRDATVEYVHGVKLRIVQVAVNQADKFDDSKAVEIVNAYLTQSSAPGLEDVTHIIWPEGAIVGFALRDQPFLRAMGRVQINGDPTPPEWIITTLRAEEYPVLDGKPGESDVKYFNSMVQIGYDVDGVPTLLSVNDKYRLVPFGEYIPGGEIVEDMGARLISTSLGSITPAERKTITKVPGLPAFSPQVCYEIVFSRLTPRNDPLGAPQWILNQSNDAWFGHSIGPQQHANMAAYRAIEEGLPVIRAASNGLSGVIDPWGRWQSRLDVPDTGVTDVALPLPREKKRIGTALNFWLALLITSGALCLMAVTSLARR